jgi:hypothetical protein
MVQVFRLYRELKESLVKNVFHFFQAGRSAYIFLCGLFLILLGIIVMMATFDSREALAAPPGFRLQPVGLRLVPRCRRMHCP